VKQKLRVSTKILYALRTKGFVVRKLSATIFQSAMARHGRRLTRNNSAQKYCDLTGGKKTLIENNDGYRDGNYPHEFTSISRKPYQGETLCHKSNATAGGKQCLRLG